MLAEGGEWKWDNTWNGVQGVALEDAPDIVQRKPPGSLSSLYGRIGIEYFVEQGLLRHTGRVDDLLRQSRINAALGIAEERAAGSTLTGPAIRPASPGYMDPDPAWVQSLTQFNLQGSKVAVITQSGFASVVAAPVIEGTWAWSTAYARAFIKNPWLTTTSTVTAGGAFATANGPTIVDALVDTGRVAPVLSGLRNVTRSGALFPGLRGSLPPPKPTVTVIGRMDDLDRFSRDPLMDTWGKSGRMPGPGERPVTWAENEAWLRARVAHGDTFAIATNPATLPPVRGGFIPGTPNGYFTARELAFLRSLGIEPHPLWTP